MVSQIARFGARFPSGPPPLGTVILANTSLRNWKCSRADRQQGIECADGIQHGQMDSRLILEQNDLGSALHMLEKDTGERRQV